MSGKDLEHFERYGWKVNETNLATLPDTAPEEAKLLTKWLTLEGRRSSLAEWLGCVDDKDSRIHGKFWHIGAWTHRMSHSNPNQANIMSTFHGTPKNAVEEVKDKYDGRLRELWTTDGYLVGADASGIQLRILAHYMKSQEYVEAIVSGDSKLETDIHNLNKKALGPLCRDRDTAKTFIYAFLLGAGYPKIAEILGCSTANATVAVANFLAALPGLKRVKEGTIKRDASRGYFIGLDGRKVLCDSEHLMLAGYLQNGEAVVMKHATVLWTRKATEAGIPYRLVDLVHDEWQVECLGSYEDATKLGELMVESLREVGHDLGLFCPLDGEFKIGKNWKETH